MSPPQPARIAAVPDLEDVRSESFMTDCHRNALERMRLAFGNELPLVILIGEGRTAASFVINRFLEGHDSDEVSITRISRPCSDAISGMRQIIRGIGFDPKDMNLADLEKIFTMFLSFQRTHRRRTIICVDDSQDNGCWMLDKIRRLVELETAGKYGLTVILSGQPGLNQRLSEPPLNAIRGHTRERIYLAPLSESESREYVQRRVEASGTLNVDHVFDFEALGVMHEITAGVPDILSELYSICLEMLDEMQLPLVTTEVVEMASARLHRSTLLPLPAVTPDATEEPRNVAQLIARIDGDLIQEQPVGQRHVLIGRDAMCDICVNHPTVSRYHALVVDSPRGLKIVDLGSTNGTFVNRRKFRQYILMDKDEISVGACRIQFVAGDDAERLAFDADRTDFFEAQDAEADEPGTELLRDISSLMSQPASTSKH
jgi:type II secretory pathway predicted ATPase ExeA